MIQAAMGDLRREAPVIVAMVATTRPAAEVPLYHILVVVSAGQVRRCKMMLHSCPALHLLNWSRRDQAMGSG